MSTYYGLVMPQVYTGGVYIRSIRQTKETDESGGVNEITATLTNRKTEVFRIKNGVSAGFGDTTATADTLEPGSKATVEVEATGDNTARDFAFKFGIPKGEPFAIYRTFPDTATMNADTSVPAGKFVIIVSSVEDEDNAKLFVRTADGYSFITDLSGAQGIKGEQGIQGEKGDKGEQGTLNADNAVTADVVDANYAVGVKADGEVTKTLWSKVWEWIKNKIISTVFTKIQTNTTVLEWLKATSTSASGDIIPVIAEAGEGNRIWFGVGGGHANKGVYCADKGASAWLLRSNNAGQGVVDMPKGLKATNGFTGNLTGNVTGTATTASNVKLNLANVAISNTVPGRLAAGEIKQYNVYNNNGPEVYGNLLNIGGQGGAQIFIQWSGVQTSAGQDVVQHMYWRSMRDNQNGWTAWKKLMNSDDAIKIPTSQPSTLENGMIWLA